MITDDKRCPEWLSYNLKETTIGDACSMYLCKACDHYWTVFNIDFDTEACIQEFIEARRIARQ